MASTPLRNVAAAIAATPLTPAQRAMKGGALKLHATGGPAMSAPAQQAVANVIAQAAQAQLMGQAVPQYTGGASAAPDSPAAAPDSPATAPDSPQDATASPDATPDATSAPDAYEDVPQPDPQGSDDDAPQAQEVYDDSQDDTDGGAFELLADADTQARREAQRARQEEGAENVYDGETLDDAQMNGDEVSNLSCYVARGRLCCTGLVQTKFGALPVTAFIPVPRGTPDGPVTFGEDSNLDGQVSARLYATADYETMRHDCEALVIRARQGDENAMGMIRAVHEGAKTGKPRARIAHGIISAYIKAHPVKESDSDPVGFEPIAVADLARVRAAVRLANGPTITGERLREIVDSFAGDSDRARRIVAFGAEHHDGAPPPASLRSQAEATLLEMGRVIGHALALQQVRQPGVSLSSFSRDASWELGE